jgi:hypothetical protein
LLIACDCLAKTGITSSYEFKKKTKQNDGYAKIIFRRQLEKEKRKNVVYRWEQIVSTYLDKRDKFRKCVECDVLSILKTDPDWKKKCVECYYNKTQIGKCLLKYKTV